MRRKYIVGNWKMNGLKAAIGEAQAIADGAKVHSAVDVAICPPFTLLSAMHAQCGDLSVGGQDCHTENSGAFTGSIAAPMLVDAGASLVIVGHSERRDGLGETSALVKEKAEAALAAGLNVIVCVGEALAVREAGDAESFVLTQIRESLPASIAENAGRVAVAYEPIWAIGTGRTASLEDIAAMHHAIRTALGAQADIVRVLYGGSVSPDNAADILRVDNVDGALVGGASLTAAKFLPIVAAAQQ